MPERERTTSLAKQRKGLSYMTFPPERLRGSKKSEQGKGGCVSSIV